MKRCNEFLYRRKELKCQGGLIHIPEVPWIFPLHKRWCNSRIYHSKYRRQTTVLLLRFPNKQNLAKWFYIMCNLTIPFVKWHCTYLSNLTPSALKCLRIYDGRIKSFRQRTTFIFVRYTFVAGKLAVKWFLAGRTGTNLGTVCMLFVLGGERCKGDTFHE